MKTLSLVILGFYFLGCGSSSGSKDKAKENNQSGRQSTDQDATRPQQKSCDGSDVEKIPGLAAGYSYRDGTQLKLMTSEQAEVSICDLMTTNSWDTAVFQLAGVTCSSCIEEAVYLEESLDKDSTKHVVVLTDFFEDYPVEMYQNFIADFAPSAYRAHDNEISLWKKLSANPSLPTRPTILVFHKSGLSYLINTEGTPKEEILSAVQTISAATTKAQASFKNKLVEDSKTETELPVLTVDFAMTGPTGALKLSDVFKKQYAVLDLSQRYCNPCLNLAAEKNSDDHFQDLVTNNQCDFIAFVGERDLSDWRNVIGASSFVGEKSYSAGRTASIPAAKFGFSLRFTPTVIIVDRSGKVLASKVGAVPDEIENLCQGGDSE